MGYASYPNPAFGYFRSAGSEGPLAGGQGSNMGPKMQGLGIFSQGQGPAQGSTWDPTILYLFALIIVEMVVVGLISRALR
jgi:hypothetical protein